MALAGWRAPWDGRGEWGPALAQVYRFAVARGQGEVYRRLLEEVVVPAEARVALDLGCGPGDAAVLLAGAHPRLRVVGVDLSATMVRVAAQRAGTNLEFRRADALDLPFADASFDLAYSFASLKCWPDRPRGLAELARVLRPGAPMTVIEAQRDASDEALAAWASRWWWLPTRALRAVWRREIARDSVDLAEARQLLGAGPWTDRCVEPLAGTPFVLLRARRG